MDCPSRNPHKVNNAVAECLARCRQSPAPIVTLSRFVADLQLSPAWSDAEIRLVETAVRRILARMMTRDSSRR